jgi:AcrR family transcriptional regulator
MVNRRDPERTRARLLAAARTEFWRRGFDGGRTERIARRARVNKALIRHHFGGKLGLYRALLADEIAGAQAALAAAVGGGSEPSEKLAAFVTGLARVLERRPWFPAILLRELMAVGRRMPEELRARFFGFFGASRTILDDGVASGAFRAVDPHAAHIALVGCLVHFALTAPLRARLAAEPGSSPAGPEPDAYARWIVDLFLRALARDPQSSRKERS